MADVYCYPDSSVLKNKLDIHDKERLLTAEIKLAAIRLYQLQEQPVYGNFDLDHLCRIHKHIFQDLYHWAGKIRTEYCKDEYVLSGAAYPDICCDHLPIILYGVYACER